MRLYWFIAEDLESFGLTRVRRDGDYGVYLLAIER